MKATVKFKNYEGKIRQLTIPVEVNEPNHIIRTFVSKARFYGLCVNRTTYITTVKCGRTIYQWFGTAIEAGA
jgi:hypothetical protein